MSFADLVGGDAQQARTRIFGVVTGVVTNNQDPEGLGRVRVVFPWLADSDESWWARIAVPMAGPSMGTYFLPEIEDEVLVAFEQGDVRFPYVVGALWSKPVPPPADNADGENNLRLIRSRAGHTILLDDTGGAEQVRVVAAGDVATITLDHEGNVKIEAEGDVAITAAGKLTLHGDGGVEITSGADLEASAEAGASLTASGTLKLEGATVNIN